MILRKRVKHRKPKPCPFCGGKKTSRDYDYGCYIVCSSCGANGPYVSDNWCDVKDTAVRAVTLWNRRVKI